MGEGLCVYGGTGRWGGGKAAGGGGSMCVGVHVYREKDSWELGEGGGGSGWRGVLHSVETEKEGGGGN